VSEKSEADAERFLGLLRPIEGELEAYGRRLVWRPEDVINGEPLRYRRTENGRFILYSVGWNETDDGGKVVLTKDHNVNTEQGDWVWRYPEK